jgi:phosphate transport system substrate-binding protein
MASDKIDADTAANLTALGDMNSPAAEHVIGFDGVAVIVNRGNTVPQLTLQQVAALFSGEITDWSKVGGAPGPVHVYTRDEKSGTRKFFERVVLKSNGKSLSPTARAFEKGTELADAVASDPGGIGFVGAASSEVARPVPIQAADGGAPLVPNPLTIRTQDYVLSRRLYLYVPPKRTSADAARFLSFVNSTAGEEIVQKSGFTPLTVTPVEKLAPPPNAPTGYVAATSAASRLTFNFYFRSGSSELDNLGINDLQTLANYLVQNHVDPARLLLIGFTDDQGDDAYNLRLSVLRAQRVSTELQRSGVRVGNSIGFGEALPTAPNSTEDGRNHNRRVEVWVKP